MLRAIWNNLGSNNPQNSNCTATFHYHPSRKLYKLDEQDMQNTAGGVKTNSKGTFSYGPLHTDDQLESTTALYGHSIWLGRPAGSDGW